MPEAAEPAAPMLSTGAALVVSPRRVVTWLMGAIGVLLTLHLATQIARFQFGRPTLMGMTERVYFGAEASIPAWFSSSLMLGCALLLLWTAAETSRRRRADAWYWFMFGIVFVLLSADEAAALHESLSPAFAGMFNWLAFTFGGPFVPLSQKPTYAWAVPGLVATVAFAVASVRFLWRLPATTRMLFLIAGGVFVGGAVGAELIGGAYSGALGANTPGFVAIMTLEETLEMVGLVLFAYAVLSYMASQFGDLHLSVGDGRIERSR